MEKQLDLSQQRAPYARLSGMITNPKALAGGGMLESRQQQEAGR